MPDLNTVSPARSDGMPDAPGVAPGARAGYLAVVAVVLAGWLGGTTVTGQTAVQPIVQPAGGDATCCATCCPAPAREAVPAAGLPAAMPVAVPAADTTSLDEHRLLRAIYNVPSPVFRGSMRFMNATAYPVLNGAPIAAWAGGWLHRGGGPWDDAYRLSLTFGAATALVFGVKNVVRRPRPYRVLAGITSRDPHHNESQPGIDTFSFPSGHATVSFALATSWSLSHPYWYVVAPSFIWAGGIALSRVWLGVHYPGDILTGAVLGALIGTAVHLIGPSVTPAALEPDAARSARGPLLLITLRL